MKVIQKENKELYQCEECRLYYKNREWAERCEIWCKEHHSCNLIITKNAIENN